MQLALEGARQHAIVDVLVELASLCGGASGGPTALIKVLTRLFVSRLL